MVDLTGAGLQAWDDGEVSPNIFEGKKAHS